MNRASDYRVRRITMTALMTALVAISTMVIKIPVPATGGYIHPGDALVLLSGLLLGPGYGVMAAGVGSALADVLCGYFIYAPATLVIKGLAALVANVLFAKGFAMLHEKIRVRVLISGVIAESLMVALYCLFESVIYGFKVALLGVPFNILQAIFGVVVAAFLYAFVAPRLSNYVANERKVF